jgi:hypothetical protein
MSIILIKSFYSYTERLVVHNDTKTLNTACDDFVAKAARNIANLRSNVAKSLNVRLKPRRPETVSLKPFPQ